MKFTVNINCDGDAFAQDCNGEVANMLELLAARIRRGAVYHRTLYDTNGNACGHATYDRTGESGYPPG